MFKGLIIKTTKKYSLIITEDNQYCKIVSKEGMFVGQRIFFFSEDLINCSLIEEPQGFWQRSEILKKSVSLSVMIACILFFFMFGGVLGLPADKASYAVVSVDINPSIEISINKEKYVTKVEILNQDGYQVAGQYLIGLKLDVALKLIINKSSETNFLKEKDTVLLAAAVNSAYQNIENNLSQSLITDLEQVNLPSEYSYLFLAADYQTYIKAKENSLSLGKYQAVLMTGGQIQPEKAKDMKVKELLTDNKIQLKLKEIDNQKNNSPVENNKNDNSKKQNNLIENKLTGKDKDGNNTIETKVKNTGNNKEHNKKNEK